MHDVAVGGRGPTDVRVPAHELAWAIEAEAAGEATPEQVALLQEHRPEWLSALQRLLRETDASLAQVRNLKGPERDQVVADFEASEPGWPGHWPGSPASARSRRTTGRSTAPARCGSRRRGTTAGWWSGPAARARRRCRWKSWPSC